MKTKEQIESMYNAVLLSYSRYLYRWNIAVANKDIESIKEYSELKNFFWPRLHMLCEIMELSNRQLSNEVMKLTRLMKIEEENNE